MMETGKAGRSPRERPERHHSTERFGTAAAMEFRGAANRRARTKEAAFGARVPERVLLIATVLMALSLPRILPDVDASAGSSVSRSLWTLLYVIALVGIALHWKAATRLVRASLPVVLVVAIAVCSSLWSEAPLLTAKESLGLAGTGLLALYLACRLSLREFIETLAFALTIIAVMSALLIAFFPDLGRMADMNGLWQGATVHKNILGIAMVLGLATMSCAMDESHGRLRTLQIAAMLLFFVLLVGSGSTTSMVVAAVLALARLILLRSRALASAKPALVAAAVLSAATVAAMTFGIGADQAFGVFGKDATLTGRTELWEVALEAIGERPALGYGYDIFFNPATATGQNAIRALSWDVNIYYAHNGFLEAALGLGLVGLLSVLTALLVGIRRAWVHFRRGRDLFSVWPLLVMIYTLLTNITEAGIARVNDLNWIVFLAAFFFVTNARPPSARCNTRAAIYGGDAH
jgi:exopolysaccharide production protein ExoQ